MADLHSPAADNGSGRVFEEKLAEKIPGPSAARTAPAVGVDTQTGDAFCNGALDPLASARSPDGQTMLEMTTRYQRLNLRTLPPWIHSVEIEEEEENEATATDRLLPSQPDDALVAQHNHSPHVSSKHEYSQSGDQSLLTEDASPPRRESRWKPFSQTIQYPRESGTEEKQVTADWMNQNLGDYSEPWRGRLLEGDSPEIPLYISTRREIWFKRFHITILRSPLVPLILRMTVWCFSLAALALGGSIQNLSVSSHHSQSQSALMAIIVDAVALVYLIYITFDEYSSKPLGLRSASAKARLILLDLFFIVFDSANLSLAFDSLSTVTGSCTKAEVNREIEPRINAICVRQKALASVLLVALLAWLMTFAISVLRLVERVTA